MVRKFISIFREKWDPGYGTTLNLTMPISGFGIPTGHPVTLGMKYRGARRDQHAAIPRTLSEMGGLPRRGRSLHRSACSCWAGAGRGPVGVHGVLALWIALLVLGFPGAVECCNRIAAYLKDGLQSSP